MQRQQAGEPEFVKQMCFYDSVLVPGPAPTGSQYPLFHELSGKGEGLTNLQQPRRLPFGVTFRLDAVRVGVLRWAGDDVVELTTLLGAFNLKINGRRVGIWPIRSLSSPQNVADPISIRSDDDFNGRLEFSGYPWDRPTLPVIERVTEERISDLVWPKRLMQFSRWLPQQRRIEQVSRCISRLREGSCLVTAYLYGRGTEPPSK